MEKIIKIDLTGKTAIVTGSIQGIGKEIAKMLALCGASGIINRYRNSEKLEKVAKEISNAGGTVTAVLADVVNKHDAKKLIEEANNYGSIDILVNNAGGLVKRVSVADYDEAHLTG